MLLLFWATGHRVEQKRYNPCHLGMTLEREIVFIQIISATYICLHITLNVPKETKVIA